MKSLAQWVDYELPIDPPDDYHYIMEKRAQEEEEREWLELHCRQCAEFLEDCQCVECDYCEVVWANCTCDQKNQSQKGGL